MSKYDEEYEKMNLYDFADELVEPLSTVKQDLTKIIYIHYAKERDENEQLQQENNQLKEKNSIYKSAIKGQIKKIEELENELNKRLKESGE